ncbi:hypothetical protein HO173_005398 [Letharia columbiana]|uniref:Uncharacterized protein n=1 Tax=Letharia columbiana TaxID=112416 RepID=A0A8H6FXP6_9LECA|nr:uncharacterized protein HO173_005398 [Letharia columbiana]KAF6236617.1 hypothetical protein HO173_005398 [Letharia columbiana]
MNTMATKNIIVNGASRGTQVQSPDIIHYLPRRQDPEIELLQLRPFSTGVGHAVAIDLLWPALSCIVLLAARTVVPLEELQAAYPTQAI